MVKGPNRADFSPQTFTSINSLPPQREGGTDQYR
jgi:hypothetical protein